MLRDFFLGFAGLFLVEERRRHGSAPSPGTRYPIVRSLTEAGYLLRDELVQEVVAHRPPVAPRRARASRGPRPARGRR